MEELKEGPEAAPLGAPGSDSPREVAATYEWWSERGAAATREGDFEAALDAYTRAAECACAREDGDFRDKAALNLAMVRIQAGDAKRGEEGLREILLRCTDPRLRFTAAYHLASSLRKQGKHEKALGYARRAVETASALGEPEFVGPAHNLVGNVLLTQNRLEEAGSEYAEALRVCSSQPGDSRYLRAIFEENLGYCLLLAQRRDEGMARIRSALSLAEAVGDRRCRAECLQDLCYGHLLLGEHEKAAETGEAALEGAVRGPYPDIEENCHYLLGEIGSRTGDLERRDRHFKCLARLHPELPFLEDFLCAVDVTGIITLKR